MKDSLADLRVALQERPFPEALLRAMMGDVVDGPDYWGKELYELELRNDAFEGYLDSEFTRDALAIVWLKDDEREPNHS